MLEEIIKLLGEVLKEDGSKKDIQMNILNEMLDFRNTLFKNVLEVYKNMSRNNS